MQQYNTIKKDCISPATLGTWYGPIGLSALFKQAKAPDALLAEQADQELQELVKQLNFAFLLQYQVANEYTAAKSTNYTSDCFKNDSVCEKWP